MSRTMAARAAKPCLMPWIHFIVLSLIAFAPSDTARAVPLTQLCWPAPSLVGHFGEYVFNQIRDHEELSGAAVIALHRLSKKCNPRYRPFWICHAYVSRR